MLSVSLAGLSGILPQPMPAQILGTSPIGRPAGYGQSLGVRVGSGDLLDYPRGQDADLDVGTLRGPAQQVERLVGSAPVLGHQDTFGLLDYGHGIQPGLQPGKRGIMQSPPLRLTLLDFARYRQ